MMRNRLRHFETPWTLLDQLHRQTLSNGPSRSGDVPTNVWTDDDRATVAMELPGLDVKTVEVSVDGDLLTVRSERLAAPSEGETLLDERPRGEFARSVRLPFDAEAADVTASYQRGVLLITVPKAEAARPTRVPVLAG